MPPEWERPTCLLKEAGMGVGCVCVTCPPAVVGSAAGAQVSGLLVQCSFADISLSALSGFSSLFPSRNVHIWGLHTSLR